MKTQIKKIANEASSISRLSLDFCSESYNILDKKEKSPEERAEIISDALIQNIRNQFSVMEIAKK